MLSAYGVAMPSKGGGDAASPKSTTNDRLRCVFLQPDIFVPDFLPMGTVNMPSMFQLQPCPLRHQLISPRSTPRAFYGDAINILSRN